MLRPPEVLLLPSIPRAVARDILYAEAVTATAGIDYAISQGASR